jgi:hypothetical protein
MFGSVLTVAASHETDINAVPALVKSLGDLEEVTGGMAEQFELTVPPSGATDARKMTMQALVRAGLEVAGAIHSYATEAEDGELAARVRFSESSLARGGPAQLAARCRAIAALAAENLASLADANISQAKLTAFGKKIEAAEKGALKPRESTVRRSAANQALARLRRKGNTILKGRVDKLMVPFRETQPEFYGEYKAARRIVDSRNATNGNPASLVAGPTAGRNGNGTSTAELATEVTR